MFEIAKDLIYWVLVYLNFNKCLIIFFLFSVILIGGLQNTPTLTTATQRLRDTFPEIMWPKRIPLSLMSKSEMK